MATSQDRRLARIAAARRAEEFERQRLENERFRAELNDAATAFRERQAERREVPS